MSVMSKEEQDYKIRQLIVVMNLLSNDAMPIEEWHRFVDAFEAQYADNIGIPPRMEHTLLDGMYTRRIYMDEGCYFTSGIHKTEHPFVILSGKILVRTHTGSIMYQAPYRGITKPGTRRILLALEDTVWETFHATQLKSVTEIVDSLSEDRINPLLTDVQIARLKSSQQETNLLN